MSNNKTKAVEDLNKVEAAAPAQGATTPVPVPEPNFTVLYRREHPGARCSYGIPGNPGIIVFDEGLFAGYGKPGFQAPASITLSCEMVLPKADNRTAKAEAQAAKLAERAAKAQARIEAAAKKAEEKKQKAEAALAAAKARIDAATKTA